MNNWQYAAKSPSLPGRGEMTTARTLYLRQPSAHTSLTPSQEPLMLVQQPILPTPSYKPSSALFGASPYLTVPQINERISDRKLTGSVYLLRVTLDPGDAAEAGIRLRRGTVNPNEAAAEETVIGVDREKGRIFVDRIHSGKTDWSPDFPTAFQPRSSIRRRIPSASKSSSIATQSRSLRKTEKLC